MAGEALRSTWPLFGLSIRVGGVELVYPGDEELPELLARAAEGIHDAGSSPFSINWSESPSPQRERDSLRFYWRRRAEFSPECWSLPFAVRAEGRLVGVQELSATNFVLLRGVTTGSWLTRAAQGRGIGTAMRAAALELAFAGLGALEAHTSAFAFNVASIAVTRKLGYEPNGEEIARRGEHAERALCFRLDRERWSEHRLAGVEITGLAECLELFGLADEPSA